MTGNSLLQILLFLGVLGACVVPLGAYMARVYTGKNGLTARLLGPIERILYRLCGIDPSSEMTWRTYAVALILFSFAGFGAVYGLQRLQGMLPFNPAGFPGVSPDSSFNTSVSFVTNTNWQGYGGESTMSHLTQMAALTTQNFLSAAVGMAVMVALVRGFTRANTGTIGNFWSDMVRGVLYILMPLSLVLALALVSQGVVQTWTGSVEVPLVEALTDADGKPVTTQTIALGPVASQVAIKQLGTNGGGYFNVNSAHPLENSTPLSNFLEVLAILLIPAALCHTFGELVGDRRQGWALLVAMTLVLVPLIFAVHFAEQRGNPGLADFPVNQQASALQPGGNMEGKEVRFGIVNSAIWAVSTTAASNGSVNSMHDSFTPLGGMVPMWLMQLGEVIFGGVGSGLYGMVIFALLSVFIAGLMVGRTPEYLGKKLGAFEIKMAATVILLPCALTLGGTAIAVMVQAGKETIFNPGPHGFSEVLYAFSSTANNNGSAFAGLGANNPFYNGMFGLAMLAGRFLVILPVLAIAGSLAAKKTVPPGAGTLPTHTPLFVILLVSVVLVVGALSYLPALALGPVVEHLSLSVQN